MFMICIQTEDGVHTVTVREDGTGLSTSTECYDEHENLVFDKERVKKLVLEAKIDLDRFIDRFYG